MKKHSYRHTGVHKNLARLDFLFNCYPAIGPKFRELFDANKSKETGTPQRRHSPLWGAAREDKKSRQNGRAQVTLQKNQSILDPIKRGINK
nr:MAG TPA: Protein of unknown function (DUF2740) [Caudoviricetes sp.]